MRNVMFMVLLAAPLFFAMPAAKAEMFKHTSGTEITQEQLAAVAVGKTTKQEVMDAFGAPSRREQLGDTQVWYYDFTKIAVFSKDKSEATVFEFDKSGVVASKGRSGGGGGAKTGNPLLDAANGH